MSVDSYGAAEGKHLWFSTKPGGETSPIQRFDTRQAHVTNLKNLTIKKYVKDTDVIEDGGLFNIFNRKFDIVHDFLENHVEALNTIIDEIEQQIKLKQTSNGGVIDAKMYALKEDLEHLARNLLRTRNFVGQNAKSSDVDEENDAVKNLYTYSDSEGQDLARAPPPPPPEPILTVDKQGKRAQTRGAGLVAAGSAPLTVKPLPGQ